MVQTPHFVTQIHSGHSLKRIAISPNPEELTMSRAVYVQCFHGLDIYTRALESRPIMSEASSTLLELDYGRMMENVQEHPLFEVNHGTKEPGFR